MTDLSTQPPTEDVLDGLSSKVYDERGYRQVSDHSTLPKDGKDMLVNAMNDELSLEHRYLFTLRLLAQLVTTVMPVADNVLPKRLRGQVFYPGDLMLDVIPPASGFYDAEDVVQATLGWLALGVTRDLKMALACSDGPTCGCWEVPYTLLGLDEVRAATHDAMREDGHSIPEDMPAASLDSDSELLRTIRAAAETATAGNRATSVRFLRTLIQRDAQRVVDEASLKSMLGGLFNRE